MTKKSHITVFELKYGDALSKALLRSIKINTVCHCNLYSLAKICEIRFLVEIKFTGRIIELCDMVRPFRQSHFNGRSENKTLWIYPLYLAMSSLGFFKLSFCLQITINRHTHTLRGKRTWVPVIPLKMS